MPQTRKKSPEPLAPGTFYMALPDLLRRPFKDKVNTRYTSVAGKAGGNTAHIAPTLGVLFINDGTMAAAAVVVNIASTCS